MSAPPSFRRLVLDLARDAATPQTARAAAEFARLLHLDLHCLFIEDEAISGLAALPFARELRLPGHEWRPIDPDALAAEFARAAAQASRLAAEAGRALGVTSAFEVMRGDPGACLAALSRATDIIVLAEPGEAAARLLGEDRPRHAAYRSPAAVLLLPPRAGLGAGPVVALLRDPADPGLALAARIAANAGARLLLLAAAPLPAAALQAATAEAGLPAERVAVRNLPGMEAEHILAALPATGERLIVLTRPEAEPGLPVRLLRACATPVLMLEPTPAVSAPADPL